MIECRICPDLLTRANGICRETLLTPFVSKHPVNALCIVLFERGRLNHISSLLLFPACLAILHVYTVFSYSFDLVFFSR